MGIARLMVVAAVSGVPPLPSTAEQSSLVKLWKTLFLMVATMSGLRKVKHVSLRIYVQLK